MVAEDATFKSAELFSERICQVIVDNDGLIELLVEMHVEFPNYDLDCFFPEIVVKGGNPVVGIRFGVVVSEVCVNLAKRSVNLGDKGFRSNKIRSFEILQGPCLRTLEARENEVILFDAVGRPFDQFPWALPWAFHSQELNKQPQHHVASFLCRPVCVIPAARTVPEWMILRQADRRYHGAKPMAEVSSHEFVEILLSGDFYG